MTDSELLFVNGLNGETGQYLYPPTSVDALADAIWKHEVPPDLPADDPTQDENYDPKRISLADVDAKDLSRTGWGVMYPAGIDPRIKRALAPLTEMRRDQVRRSDYFHEFYVPPGQTAEYFLRDAKAQDAIALRPERLPYYLLIVGSPEEISYELQLKLGGSVAVGRIDFDHPRDYRTYAENVVACSDGRAHRPRDIAFFGVRHKGDTATCRTLKDLTIPLANFIENDQPRFTVRRIFEADATKDCLISLYRGKEAPPPAVLFAAGHGLAYKSNLEYQKLHQGALVCSNFTGPYGEDRPIPEEAFFQASDLDDDADLRGMVVMHFSCYGAGTPVWNSYARTLQERTRRAAEPFTALLPRRLLSKRNGALAFIGHVDSSWTTSFSRYGESSQTDVLEEILRLLLRGEPVGNALDPMRELWDHAARKLSDLWKEKHLGRPPTSKLRLVQLWRTNDDAQGWVICGDPAVTVAARGMS